MNIRQAARKAQREEALWITNRQTGDVDYIYAIYDSGTLEVETIGSYETCKSFMPPAGQQASNGKWLTMVALEQIIEEMEESDGEARCLPDACEMREWS